MPSREPDDRLWCVLALCLSVCLFVCLSFVCLFVCLPGFAMIVIAKSRWGARRP